VLTDPRKRRATSTRTTTAGAVLAVAFLLAFPVSALAQAANPLAGQWHLDEIRQGPTSSSTPDSSGHGLDGAVLGVSLVPGRFGSAFNFDGEVRVGRSSTLEPPALTVLAWVKRTGTPGTGRYVVAKGARGCATNSYALSTGASGGLQFSVSDGGANVSLSPAAGPGLWDGQWHAVAGTFDGQTVRFYLDGLQVGSGTAASAPVGYALDNDDFVLGRYPLQAGCASGYYTGATDEVRVYSRALSASEIGRLQTAPGSTPPVLQPDATPPPPPPPPGLPNPPGPPTPPPGQAGPAPAPRVTAVASALPIVASRPALLSAQVAGSAQRLEWDLTGDGKTDVSCAGDQTTLEFRPPARAGASTGQVSVRVVGAAGAGPSFSQKLAIAPAPAIAGNDRAGKRISSLVASQPPVYACGRASDLPAARGELTGKADLSERYCLVRPVTAGSLQLQGCLKRIRKVEDIPPAERGLTTDLAFFLLKTLAPRGQVNALAQRTIDLTDAYVAVGPITVNGVDLEPRGDARIVIWPQVNKIASSDASMSVGGIELKHERDFDLDTTPVAGGKIPLGNSFPRLPGSTLKALGAFGLVGNVGVVLEPDGGSTITVQLELPEFLRRLPGVSGRGEVRLRATNADGLVLDRLSIGPIDAGVEGVGISGLKLEYTRATGEWRGQGRACPVAGGCLDMIPPNGGVVIRNGGLKSAGASLSFPPPGLQLYPGVGLSRIGFRIGLDPTRVVGNAKVTTAGTVDYDGRLVMAFPSTAAPFVLDRGEVGDNFPEKFYGRRFTRSTFAIAADASIAVPVLGRKRLGGAYLVYEYPGYVGLGGSFDEGFAGVVSIRGRVDGELNIGNGRFNLGGRVESCVLDIVCRGAAGVVSSAGVGACVTVSVESFLGDFEINIGGGVRYSPFDVILWPFDGCRWSRFEEPNVFEGRAMLAQAGGARTVRVDRGDPSRAIRLDGAGGAPRVQVKTPGGEVLTSSEGPGVQASKTMRILRSDKLKATVIGLVDPKPGTYTIEPLPGSPTIAKLTEAQDPPAARVKASISGQGVRRTLAYDVAQRPGQRVTFVEKGQGGSRTIGTVSGGRGQLAFSPAPGSDRRTVEAQFELAGVPAERLTVARFAPPSARLGRPGRLLVRRAGDRLRVSWLPVSGATSYTVLTTLATGAQRATTTRRNSATIRPVTPTSGGLVAVRAVASMRQGSVRTARFKATAPPAPTRFGPLPRLKKRGR